MNQKLQNATNLYLEGIRDGDARHAVKKYTGVRYTQHSTGVKDGVDGFIEFFEPFIQRCPNRDIRIFRSIVDGQYVFLQVCQNINNGEAYWLTTDLFDTDSNDKIIEHWDVISAYKYNADVTQDQISGPNKPINLNQTAENKEIVREFLLNVMVLGGSAQSYIDFNYLWVHAPSDIAPPQDYVGDYVQVVRLIGEGDMVVSYNRVIHQGVELARFDMFRVSEGAIVEWWVNQEEVPPKAEWVNGGKF